ncbi:MAG: HTTM domain-containing protein [Gemmataceae bacterium]
MKPSSPFLVGLQPWLPWPLHRWVWWTEPVRAERLAALRIALAGVLLLDILLTYLPHATVFYGAGSLGSPEIFAYLSRAPRWHWSLLRWMEDPWTVILMMLIWTTATFCLLIGWWTRINAILVWVLSTSFANLNPYLENAGDEVRGILLFYLMLCPCGAVWSLDHWRRRRSGAVTTPVFIHPWPLRLLFVQMTLIYFCNGLYKLRGSDWISGNSLYYVLSDLTLARWSYAHLPTPYLLTRILSYTVLIWEVAFPLLMLLPWLLGSMFWLCRLPERIGHPVVTWSRWLRIVALGFGVLFHLGSFVSLEIGMFAPYMLCFYVPLIRMKDEG